MAEAITQLKAAVAADPDYAEAHTALAEALTQQGRTADEALERQQPQRLAQAQHLNRIDIRDLQSGCAKQQHVASHSTFSILHAPWPCSLELGFRICATEGESPS